MEKNRQKKNIFLVFVFLLFVTFFSIFFFPGYQVFYNDQGVYVPQIYQKIDNSLYENDFSLSFTQTDYSLFDELIILLINDRPDSIFIVFLALTVIFRFIYFFSIYRISHYFTRNIPYSAFSVLLFVAPLTVFGTSTTSMDIELHPRLISVSLGLAFIALHLSGRRIIPAILLGLSALIHPIMSAPFFIFFYIDLIYNIYRRGMKLCSRNVLTAILPLCFLAFLIIYVAGQSDLNLFNRVDANWAETIKFRTSFVYITTWGETAWTLFIFSLFSMFIIFIELKNYLVGERKKYFMLLILIPVLLSVLSLVLFDIFNLQIVGNFQLARSLLLFKIIILILFVLYLFILLKEKFHDFILVFFIAGLIFSFLINEYLIFIFFPLFFLRWLQIKKLKIKESRSYSKSPIKPQNVNLVITDLFLYFVVYTAISFSVLFFTPFQENLRLVFYEVMAANFAAFVTAYSLQIFGRKIIFAIDYHNNLWKLITPVIVLMVGAILISMPNFSFRPVYAHDNQFNELCDWISGHTKHGTVFLVEPYSNISYPIRLSCYRSVYVTRGDSSQGFFNKEYATEWQRRYNEIGKLHKEEDKISVFLSREGIDYIVSEKEFDNLRLLFNNDKYYVYESF